jgi:hypothetical protein
LLSKGQLTEKFNLRGRRVLGDIPIDPANDIDPAEVARSAEQARLGFYVVPDAEKKERGAIRGTVYLYDRQQLQRELDENKDMLRKEEWPAQADDFIRRLSYVTAPANSDLYAFISRLHDVDGKSIPWKGADNPAEAAQQQYNAEMSKMVYRALQQNDRAGAEWVRNEARAGHLGAMSSVSLMYSRGKGFKQDYAEAAFWAGVEMRTLLPGYRQMLREGHPNVGELMGPDVKASDSDAAISSAVAARTQLHDFVKLRDDAIAKLTPDQIQAVEKCIAEWRPAPGAGQWQRTFAVKNAAQKP